MAGSKLVYAHIAAAALAAVVLALASMGAALGAYNSWVGYRNPYADSLRRVEPVRVSGAPVARHVVFILLDGLSADVLEDLSRRGGDAARLVSMGAFYPNGLANTPTYSIPARASILTGAPPEINGVLSNEYTGAVEVDSIVRAAREAGFKILCSGDASVEMLFREYIDECALVEEGGGQGALALAEGLNLLRRYSGMGHSVFLWISVNDVDMIGHLAGGAGAPEYNSTAANVVKLTLNAVQALAGEDALVVILSDHGFKRGGHHGGPEPEVRRVFTLLVGPGVKPGVYTTGYTHNDIAPTVAMLMGLRLPAQSIGKPLEEGFNLPSGRVEAYRRASLEQARRVVGALSEASGVRIPEGADPLEAHRVITGRLYSESMGFRLAAALALALLVPAGLYASLRARLLSTRSLILVLAAILAYETAFWATYRSAKGPFSLSDVKALGDLMDKVMLASAVAGLTVGLLLGLAELTPFRAGLPKALVPALTAMTLAVALSLACAAPFYVSYGSTVRFPPPDWKEGFRFFLYLTKASFTTLVGMALATATTLALSIAGHYVQKASRKPQITDNSFILPTGELSAA
ncbi:MAG: alkaline phosphatase family protein [Thermofilaceae archaeon]